MPRRLKLDRVRWELKTPETRSFLLSLLNFINYRTSVLADYRKLSPGITLLDALIADHIGIHYVIDANGTRQQWLVNTVQAPRRTIRDGLVRLVGADLVVRIGDLYYPTDALGDILEANFNPYLQMSSRLAERTREAREALRRRAGD